MSPSKREISKDDIARIFEEEVVPQSGIGDLKSHENPKAIILAGQSGAGKSGLARSARAELSGDVVTIDQDRLREFDPEVRDFRKAHPYTWSSDTQAVSGKLTTSLRDLAIDERKNIIIDTTLGDARMATTMVEKLKKNGYDVEVRAMAAHRIESELGVEKRFSGGVDADGYGRYVPEEFRKKAYEALPGNLDRVQAETNTPVRIFNREGAQLYDSRTSPMTPGAALEQAREARLQDPKVTKALSQGWREQQAWHQDLPDSLAQNRKIQPSTADALLVERSELKVVENVSGLAGKSAELDSVVRVRPNLIKGSVGGVLGVGAMAYDAASTYKDASQLYAQGNSFGAESKIVGAVSRNVGGLAGVGLGAAAGAAVTSETGPGALIGGAVGGVLGAVAGDKVAEWIDQHRINNQSDKDGNNWTFNPKNPEQGWIRTGKELDLEAMRYSDGAPVYKPETLKASPALADELNYKASNMAVSLAISAPPKATDPYRLPANEHDARSVHEIPWVRNPNSEQWTRLVVDGYIDRSPQSHTETASPQRAAELERDSQAIIKQNAERTPAAMAANYTAAYNEYGWSRHGDIPDAVKDAAKNPGRLIGSDGEKYERDAGGQWTSHGMIWDSNPNSTQKKELDSTYEQQQRNLNPKTLAPVEVRPDPQVPTLLPSGISSPKRRSPEDQDHPENAVYEKIKSGVQGLDQQAGKSWDQHSERITASMLTLAAEKKFTADDDLKVAFNKPTSELAGGQIVHLYRVGGSSPDPAANRASMPTAEALSVPAEDRYQQVENIRKTQSETAEQERQQTLSRGGEDQSRNVQKVAQQ
ncbi:zeta toxin family protein [Luteimonas panaciterrae]|uniref:zeta toxin family protein n=1 Tax=Luteimonas panaciterrae TaxID=363885 RepID=UPI001CF9E5FF|nr:zeta toxin family protein [Luteimonas panaciterrae]